MRIYDYLKPLGVKVGLIKDYVTEYKTIDGWECETWASGKKVARTTFSGISTGSLSASGYLYYKTNILLKTLPTDFFTEIKTVAGDGTHFAETNSHLLVNTSTGRLTANVSRTISGSFTLSGNCLLIGR